MTNSTTSTTFSGHTTTSMSGSGSIVRVASRCRSVTTRLGTSSARVPCSPPPCTATTSTILTGARAPRRHQGQHHDHHAGPERQGGRAVEPSPPHPVAINRCAATDTCSTNQVSRITPPTRANAGERATDLRDAQRRQRHAAEREAHPPRFDQRVGGGPGHQRRPARRARPARRRRGARRRSGWRRCSRAR